MQPGHPLVPSQPWRHLLGAPVGCPQPQHPCSPASSLGRCLQLPCRDSIDPNLHTASSCAGAQQEIRQAAHPVTTTRRLQIASGSAPEPLHTGFSVHIKDTDTAGISPKADTLQCPERTLLSLGGTWKARVGEKSGFLHPGCVSGGQGRESKRCLLGTGSQQLRTWPLPRPLGAEHRAAQPSPSLASKAARLP